MPYFRLPQTSFSPFGVILAFLVFRFSTSSSRDAWGLNLRITHNHRQGDQAEADGNPLHRTESIFPPSPHYLPSFLVSFLTFLVSRLSKSPFFESGKQI